MLDTFDADQIFLSFNGGKDCTVLLHLVSELYAKRCPGQRLLSLYIQPAEPFDEIEAFVHECAETYRTDVTVIRGDTKSALEQMCKQKPTLKACIMGSRRTDPFCGTLQAFQATDPGWPAIVRVNPLLEWTCRDVWQYIHANRVPYCSLYKLG